MAPLDGSSQGERVGRLEQDVRELFTRAGIEEKSTQGMRSIAQANALKTGLLDGDIARLEQLIKTESERLSERLARQEERHRSEVADLRSDLDEALATARSLKLWRTWLAGAYVATTTIAGIVLWYLVNRGKLVP